MKRRLVAVVAVVSVWSACLALAGAEKEGGNAGVSGVKLLNEKMLRTLAPSVCQVDYCFRRDEKGRVPDVRVRYLCPNCHEYHTRDIEESLNKNIPASFPAFAVGTRELVSSDPGLLNEWIDRIEVRSGSRTFPARISAYFPERGAVALELTDPAAKLEAIRFDGKREGKLHHFFVAEENGVPFAGVSPHRNGEAVKNLASGVDYRRAPVNTVVCDDEGRAVTLSFRELLPATEDALSVPGSWKRIGAEERDRDLEEKKQLLKRNFLPVSIALSQTSRGRKMRGEEEKNEFDAIGMLMTDGKVLVRQELSPEQTARLENIVLTCPDGKKITARFHGSLREWGVLVVEPDKKIDGAGMEFFRGGAGTLFDCIVYTARIANVDGRTDVVLRPERLQKFQRVRNGCVVPDTDNFSGKDHFMFSGNMQLLALPLAQRGEDSAYGSETEMVDGNVLYGIFASKEPFDPDNVPRSAEAGKTRFAWIGADFQRLTPELAKSKKVSALTRSGYEGALVARVMPDSPAAEAGIREGDVIVYCRTLSGKTLSMKSYDFSDDEFRGNFPWKEYDRVPEQYFEMIPQPWPKAVGALNRQFTRIGVGKQLKVGVSSDGNFSEKILTLAPMPPHFDVAPRYNARDFGFSAADATFEVRDYFRMKENDPGVIVSKVVPGGKASVAGVKPYEIIIDVDGVKVHNVEELKKQLSGKSAFALTVRRMTADRVVKFQ